MKRLITIITLALVLAIILAGCSAPDMAPTAAPAGGAPAPSAPAAAPAAPPPVVDRAPAPEIAMEATDGDAHFGFAQVDESPVALPLLTPSDSRGRRLVYTVDMQIQTTEFMPGKRLLINTLGNFGGWVESEHLEGRDMRFPNRERNVRYTLRIHSNHLSEFLMIVEDNFNLVTRWQISDDVTASYAHSESALDDLRDQEARIREHLADENVRMTAADRRNLERNLSEIQSSIRTHERRINIYDDFVMYSTVHVHLFEVIFPEEQVIEDVSFGDRFNEALVRALDGIVGFFQGAAIVIILVLPTLLLLAAIAATVLIIIFIIRKVGKKRKNARYESLNRGNPYRTDTNNEDLDNKD